MMMINLMLSYTDAWRRYFDFSGNTSRKMFWLFMLAHLCITLLFTMIDIWSTAIWQGNIGWFDLTYSLISFIPMLAIITRRLHDTGLSGWWGMVFIFPTIGPFWLIYLLCQTVNINNHGGQCACKNYSLYCSH